VPRRGLGRTMLILIGSPWLRQEMPAHLGAWCIGVERVKVSTSLEPSLHGTTDKPAAAEGVMEVGRDGVGRFKSVVLRPTVTVAKGSDPERARTLHKPAHKSCFIANSVNFTVEREAEIDVSPL
jgi:hypothetical protein